MQAEEPEQAERRPRARAPPASVAPAPPGGVSAQPRPSAHEAAAALAMFEQDPPPPPLRTNRTRRVLHPVLIGRAASLTPY